MGIDKVNAVEKTIEIWRDEVNDVIIGVIISDGKVINIDYKYGELNSIVVSMLTTSLLDNVNGRFMFLFDLVRNNFNSSAPLFLKSTASEAFLIYKKMTIDNPIVGRDNSKDSHSFDVHQLARLFMDQFSYTTASLDEFLIDNQDNLTDDERNLGYYILEIFNNN